MEKAPQALAETEVLDSQGRPRRMSTLWAERPALLIFLRHFG